jgi:hypothetical protein
LKKVDIPLKYTGQDNHYSTSGNPSNLSKRARNLTTVIGTIRDSKSWKLNPKIKKNSNAQSSISENITIDNSNQFISTVRYFPNNSMTKSIKRSVYPPMINIENSTGKDIESTRGLLDTGELIRQQLKHEKLVKIINS